MPKKIRICLVIPSLHAGGMERVMSELAGYFCSMDSYQVHLILYGISRDVFYDIPRNIIIHRPNFEFDNSKRFWYSIRTLYFLRKKITEIQPESILSFGELWNNFVLIATFGLKFPVFISDRCQPDKPLSGIQEHFRKYLYPHAAGIICQTETAKRIYQDTFKHANISVIGNPIQEILPIKDFTKQNIVLSVGRLIETKHHDELIQIFTAIAPQNWKLVIVGDDALRQQNKKNLEQLIFQLGMQTRIILAGKQSNVDEFYNVAKIFAFTSSSEGFPNVIGEAMAAGLPVVAYDCVAGPSDLIDDNQTGFLVPLHDKNKFQEKLKFLIENEKIRNSFSRNAQKKIAHFSTENMGRKYLEFIIHE